MPYESFSFPPPEVSETLSVQQQGVATAVVPKFTSPSKAQASLAVHVDAGKRCPESPPSRNALD